MRHRRREERARLALQREEEEAAARQREKEKEEEEARRRQAQAEEEKEKEEEEEEEDYEDDFEDYEEDFEEDEDEDGDEEEEEEEAPKVPTYRQELQELQRKRQQETKVQEAARPAAAAEQPRRIFDPQLALKRQEETELALKLRSRAEGLMEKLKLGVTAMVLFEIEPSSSYDLYLRK